MARASIHVVNLSAGTQYVLPATEVAYILLKSSARTDTSGRFRFVPEVVVVSDAVAMSVAKAITADSFGIPDAASTHVTKVLGDSVTMTETFVATLIFIRSFSDAVAVSEAYAVAVSKALLDTAITLDSKALTVNKALSADTVLPQDTNSKGVIKPLTDSASVADAALVSMFFPRTLADSTVVTDSTSLQTAKVFGDASAVTDALTRDFVKSLVSGVAMNDSFDAGDGAVFVFTKGVSNIVFAVDSRVLFTDKLIGDMIEPVDTGVLTVQNYCDITYFAADYVGVSQTFS